MNSPVQQIKERLSVEEVVSSYLKLERTGANFKAKCPFHTEKTPSFFVSPARGSYYCFGCGASGDIFSFIEEFEGLDFKGALKLLADRAGVVLHAPNREEESEKDRLYKIHEEATAYFQDNLSNEIMAYLKARGLTNESVKSFRIGFANEEWRGLYTRLKGKWTEADLEKAGLIIKSEKNYYDRFRGRIMFPIADSSGRIIAFSGRILKGDEKVAKYVNSPETLIFSKSATLYGLDRAKDSIRKNNFSILVEGQFDIILAHQAGYKNTVATSGTALTDTDVSKDKIVTNLGLIRRLSQNIVLAFDGDKAGVSACERAGRIALSLGMDVKVAGMPEGMDPADLISKNGEDAWKQAIKKSTHLIEYLLERVLKESRDPRKAGRLIREKILPFVLAIESRIEQDHFIKKLSGASGISEVAVREDLKNLEKDLKYKERGETAKTIAPELNRRDYIIRKLLGVIFWQKTLKDKGIDVSKITKEVEELTGKKIDELDERWGKSDLIFEAEVFYSNQADITKDVDELLLNLKEEKLKEEVGVLMQKLYEGKNQDSGGVLIRIKELNEEIQNIKNKRK